MGIARLVDFENALLINDRCSIPNPNDNFCSSKSAVRITSKTMNARTRRSQNVQRSVDAAVLISMATDSIHGIIFACLACAFGPEDSHYHLILLAIWNMSQDLKTTRFSTTEFSDFGQLGSRYPLWHYGETTANFTSSRARLR